MCFLTMTLILFLIMDPIGNLTSFERVLGGVPEENRTKVLAREMFFALGFMVLFTFIGDLLIDAMHISNETVYLASGVILFLTAMGILYPSSKSIRNNLSMQTPFIIPLAVPLIAGPALLATIILFAKTDPNILCRLQAVGIAWVAACVILYFRGLFIRFLGGNGIGAAERVMGMILVLLAIQRIIEGIEILKAL